MSAKPPTAFPFPSLHNHHICPLPVPDGSDPRTVHQMDPSVLHQPRTFFPYIPNEVKHRKRTSRHQLKVLEDVFRKDTKPNAVLRKKLAAELEMSPRAVQVWFQNRRAKEKALRKRVNTNDQDKPGTPSAKKSPPPRDTSPNDSSHSSTATEKLAHHLEDDGSVGAPPTSPVLKISCSPPSLPASPPPAWSGLSGTPAELLLDGRPLDPSGQYSDAYGARRGSLPAVMPSQPLAETNLMQPPVHYPDRRKSMDVSFYRLMHHPFARIAKEKNEALYLPKSPLSPVGSIPATVSRSLGLRPNGHGYPHSRPTLSHRASEPQVFAPVRNPFPPVPEGGPLESLPPPARTFSDNRLFAISSRVVSSPIPGPLPTPDFQFGDPSSVSPPNASPTPGEVEPPPVPMPSPEIAQLQRWSFPRSREPDQDTEDSGSYSAFTRFGSVASVSGSESSAVYSDVSSCVAADHMGYDPSTRRGSCASGNYLEMRLSGLNMTGRSSQGSLNEAHLSATAGLAYRDKLGRQDHSPEVLGGYVSPASTATPVTSSHMRAVKEPTPSTMRSDSIYDFSPVGASFASPRDGVLTSSKLSQVPGDAEIAATRRGSIQAPEPLPHLFVQNNLDPQSTSYPTSPTEARGTSVQPTMPQQHLAGGGFTPQSGYALTGESPFGSAPQESSYQPQPTSQLHYSADAYQPGSNAMGNMERYTSPAGEFRYAATHGQEPFSSFA